MAEYGLEFSFGIDNGELDGLTPQEVFVLGYELGHLRKLLEHEFMDKEIIVHARNKERIERALKADFRQYNLSFMDDDESEEYMMLTLYRDHRNNDE